ncbi:putative nucleic-acid-binding Zn-ribbon protein [Mesorhizobium shonense]|uniref:Nucleic-acid-binding Zn-ribbon protein n=1 Tax=Mesorhizobium shonense TaxID=1209948 RepID=A0ABV2HRQ7_9HYPH
MTNEEYVPHFRYMPDQPEKWPRGAAWTLTHAHDAGQVTGIRCARCNVTRYYKPAELREVIGNVTIDEVREKVRCQKCGSREWMGAELFHPTGEQAHTIRYRRLVQIRWEKRVIWRDE